MLPLLKLNAILCTFLGHLALFTLLVALVKKCPFRSDRGGLYAIGAVTLVLGASTKLLPPPLARFPLRRRKVSHIHIDVNVRWDLRKMCSAKWNARSLVKKSDPVFQIISSDEYQNIVHRFTFSSFEINRTAKRGQIFNLV